MHSPRDTWNRPLQVRLAAKLPVAAKSNAKPTGSDHGLVSVRRPEYAVGVAITTSLPAGP